MDTFAHVLVALAHATLAFWEAIKIFFGWIGDLLDLVLQPVLSPLLRILNPICAAIADVVYKLLDVFPPWVGLVLISAVAGVAMLFAFGRLSNQTGIGKAKDDIKANLLALKLFKDDLRVALRAQGRIAWALVRLQRYMFVPVLWLILPTMLLLSQMAMRYQWRPFAPGEPILLKAYFSKGQPSGATQSQVTLVPVAGLELEAGPITGDTDVAWRLRAVKPGRFAVRVEAGPTSEAKEVVVGSPGERVSPVRAGRRWTQQILYPIEPVLTVPESNFTHFDVIYPPSRPSVDGSDYWVLTFFVVSMGSALLLRPVLRVRF